MHAHWEFFDVECIKKEERSCCCVFFLICTGIASLYYDMYNFEDVFFGSPLI